MYKRKAALASGGNLDGGVQDPEAGESGAVVGTGVGIEVHQLPGEVMRDAPPVLDLGLVVDGDPLPVNPGLQDPEVVGVAPPGRGAAFALVARAVLEREVLLVVDVQPVVQEAVIAQLLTVDVLVFAVQEQQGRL